jgi:ketosteroid isomerase-like protein
MTGRPVISGKSEIMAFWKAALDGPVEAITLDTTHIEVSGDLAYGFGINTILLKPAGEVPREEKGKYVVVYRRQSAGDWKIVVDSYSSSG